MEVKQVRVWNLGAGDRDFPALAAKKPWQRSVLSKLLRLAASILVPKRVIGLPT